MGRIHLAELEPLNRVKHNRDGFTCGNVVYDRYLKEQAAKEQDQRVSVCYVLTVQGSSDIIGYYTLSSATILLPDLPASTRKKLPRYPDVPATLLGRLAASNRKEYEQERLGEHLLLDALWRAWQTSMSIGSWAVVLLAEESSKGFYLRYRFNDLPDQPLKLYITMDGIEELFR